MPPRTISCTDGEIPGLTTRHNKSLVVPPFHVHSPGAFSLDRCLMLLGVNADHKASPLRFTHIFPLTIKVNPRKHFLFFGGPSVALSDDRNDHSRVFTENKQGDV
jgi:hypothetical protein